MFAPVTASAADVPDRFEATWRSINTSRSDIDAAIEHTVSQMSWIKRPFVRGRLKASTPVCRRLRIFETDDHQLGIQCDTLREEIAPPDGTRTAWKTPDGDAFTLTHRIHGDAIVQDFVGPKGSKETVYALHGNELRIQVRIHSKHLPEDVTYALSFKA
jgi:hypothetical protein